jgi:glycosyltransferase involved in cell wall biosynthesis
MQPALSGVARAQLAFVVDTGESLDDPGVGRFYRGLIGGLRTAGLSVTPLGVSEGQSAQLATLSGRLAAGSPRTGRPFALLRQTASDIRDLARWNHLALAPGPFDAVVEFQYNGRFAGWRIARRDAAFHIVFVDQIESIVPPRRSAVGRGIRRLEQRRFHQADLVFFRTAAMANVYIDHWGEPRAWSTSHMAVDPDEFVPSDEHRVRMRSVLGVADADVVIGMVAFFAPYHRAELIGPLVRRLRAQGIRARGLLVGGWSNEAADLLERRRCESPGDWEDVIVTGAVPQRDVPGMISAFDVGAMPGSNWYGSPTKVIEYGAMGTPIVARRTGAVEEVIRDGAEGLLFQGDDELFAGVLAILDDPVRSRERAEVFRRRVIEEHTWDHRGADIAARISRLRE